MKTTHEVLRPIQSDADYQSAMDRIECLMDLDDPTQDQQDEIDRLAPIIEAYECRTVPRH